MTEQLCTFFLDDLYFGVEVTQVQEVLRYQQMTSVPLASSNVHGLINLRGQIVTAIDLRSELGLPELGSSQLPMNVVIRSSGGAISFLVDQIGDVLEVDEETFELPPERLNGVARELIRGAYKLDGKLLLVLDADRAIAMSSHAVEERAAS